MLEKIVLDVLVDWRQRLWSSSAILVDVALLEKIILDWSQRLCSSIGDKILNKLILNKLLHVHYVKSVDSLTAITGFAWFYDRTH